MNDRLKLIICIASGLAIGKYCVELVLLTTLWWMTDRAECAGLLVGGLAGHFSTKNQYESEKQSSKIQPQTANTVDVTQVITQQTSPANIELYLKSVW